MRAKSNMNNGQQLQENGLDLDMEWWSFDELDAWRWIL